MRACVVKIGDRKLVAIIPCVPPVDVGFGIFAILSPFFVSMHWWCGLDEKGKTELNVIL